MKPYIFMLLILFLVSCKITNTDDGVNNKYNRTYVKSVDGKFGETDAESLKQFYSALKENLEIEIDTTKTILINYFQKGKNCLSNSNKEMYKSKVLSVYKASSDKMSEKYKVRNILIYTKDSDFSKYANPDSGWIEDNGFIKSNIFPSDQNCSGFFIIRPDGKFYKYYGEDYFSKIRRLLAAKYWDFPNE